MMKKNNKKGFTLAELLIVVAIIAVLTAIAIPVFSSQLNKSKLATGTANARSIVAEYTAECLSAEEPKNPTVTEALGKVNAMDAKMKQGCTFSAGTNAIIVSHDGVSNTNTIPLGTGYASTGSTGTPTGSTGDSGNP